MALCGFAAALSCVAAAPGRFEAQIVLNVQRLLDPQLQSVIGKPYRVLVLWENELEQVAHLQHIVDIPGDPPVPRSG
jgi:hypothetical protein